MKHKYTPGQDCECSAYSESECGCGADWTPSEVYELREKLAAERALADRLAEAATKSSNVIGPPDKVEWSTDDELNDAWDCSRSAIAAWKEARSE